MRRRRGVWGRRDPGCGRERLRERSALPLLPPQQRPEPEEAFAAAVAGPPDSKSPAAAPRLPRPPGGGGRVRGCPGGGHSCPEWRGPAGKQLSLVPRVACLSAESELGWRRADCSFSAGLLSFVILCLHSGNLFVFDM